VVKHQNPCGAALAGSQTKAFTRAFEGDSKSAFGGIVGFNHPLDGPTAVAMKKIFFEVILAPDFTPEALDTLKKKKKLRLIRIPLDYRDPFDIKKIPGGFVVQDRDLTVSAPDTFELKTSRKLTDNEKSDIDFGWKIMKYVKSNGIIIVKNQQLVGVGAGQMSRVDSVELAIKKAQFPLEGSVLLSDAFFPFADSIEAAAEKNITVIVEPGGSIRDETVIQAAEEKGLSLVFTGIRHFRH
jgi:phosphoribosylaminoimidazolecarboxamide formyltransferase/IMP cyclohydrolase